MADWVPLASQVKSFYQVKSGDNEGALQTQINFSKRCPGISQARSIIEVFTDGEEAATETQREFYSTTVNGFLDSTPVVGHAKGIVHYAVGDNEGGYNAWKAASRTTRTMAGGALGFLAAGPPGAVVGGIVGGTLSDGVTTCVESAYHGEYKPNGIVREVTDVCQDPTNGGKWFDAAFTVASDGATGYMVGKGITKMQKAAKLRNFERQKNTVAEKIGQKATGDLIEAADRMKITREKYAVPENKPHVTSVVKDKKTGVMYEGHNEQVRKYCRSAKAKKAQANVTNADVMSDYSVDKKTATNLERKVPGVEPPLKRQPRTCAEHRAYHKFYKEYPDADPKNTRVTSVRYAKDGKIVAVKRCQNCIAYAEGMGEVPGDLIDNQIVPRNPGLGKGTSLQETGKGLVCACCGSLVQAKRKVKTEKQ